MVSLKILISWMKMARSPARKNWSVKNEEFSLKISSSVTLVCSRPSMAALLAVTVSQVPLPEV